MTTPDERGQATPIPVPETCAPQAEAPGAPMPQAPAVQPDHPLPAYPTAPELNDELVVDWHRLDARMVVVRPLNEILGLVPVLIGLLVLGNGDGWRVGISIAVVVLIIALGVLNWVTTRYRITPEQVELRTGLFVRKRLAVPRDRIRSVDLTAKLGHRLFGLSAVRLGTGSRDQPGEDGLTLDAVTSAEGERLRVLLLDHAPRTGRSPDGGPRPVEPGTTLAELDTRWLRYAPLTLSGLVGIGALFGVVVNFARELDIEVLDPAVDAAHWVVGQPLAQTIAVSVLVVAVLSTLGALLLYVLQFWGYRLTREPDGTVRVRRGLLTTRSVSLAEQRLRGVEVQEALLLRAGRGAKAVAVTTGLGRKGESSLLLPPAPRAEAHRVTSEVLRVEAPPTTAPLRGHPAAALRRRVVRAVGPALVLVAALVVWAPSWAWQAALPLVPLAALVGWDRYRSLGHALTDRYLVVRSGSLLRETVALQRTGIIGWRVRRTFFQRRAGLVTVVATTAAGDGHYAVVDVGEADGLAVADEAVPDLLRPFLLRP